MLARTAVLALNHLLAANAWARERLEAFAGRHIRLAGGPLVLELTLDVEGYFRAPGELDATAPAVTIELPADAPFRFLFDRSALLASARISGTADLTETLAFVFRNLKWDIEEDLSQVVGDIVARRVVRAGQAAVAWQQQAGRNLAANTAEYLSEESGVLVPAREMACLRSEIEALGAETARLEQRLAALV